MMSCRVQFMSLDASSIRTSRVDKGETAEWPNIHLLSSHEKRHAPCLRRLPGQVSLSARTANAIYAERKSSALNGAETQKDVPAPNRCRASGVENLDPQAAGIFSCCPT